MKGKAIAVLVISLGLWAACYGMGAPLDAAESLVVVGAVWLLVLGADRRWQRRLRGSRRVPESDVDST